MQVRSSSGILLPATALRFLFVMAASLNGCATSPADDADVSAERYQAVVASPIRTGLDRRMDATRRPAEFLAFTQVKPGMQVLDISAGGGYTTQLLALAVGPFGKVWAQTQRPGPTISKRLADQPQPNIVLVTRSVEDPVPACRSAHRIVERPAHPRRQVRVALCQAANRLEAQPTLRTIMMTSPTATVATQIATLRPAGSTQCLAYRHAG